MIYFSRKQQTRARIQQDQKTDQSVNIHSQIKLRDSRSGALHVQVIESKYHTLTEA